MTVLLTVSHCAGTQLTSDSETTSVSFHTISLHVILVGAAEGGGFLLFGCSTVLSALIKDPASRLSAAR